jgi:TRAP-type C4-dicarboxylate transport system substrate-binding protein
MGEAWKLVSGGGIELRIYAGGAVGDESDIVRKMRVGQFQAAAISGGGLPDIVPELRAMQLPMMFASNAERDYVAAHLHPEFERLAERNNMMILAWIDTGWLYFFTQSPVVTPDDLRPLAVYAWAGASGYVEAWKKAGFRPISLPIHELLPGLQTKLVNAVAAPPIAALSFQWFGLAPHMTDVKWAPLEGAIIMPLKVWERLPDELKPALLEAAQVAGDRLNKGILELSDRAIEVMKKHGLVVHPVPPEVARQWEVAARAGYPSIIGSIVPADMAAEVERLRDEYRTAHASQ